MSLVHVDTFAVAADAEHLAVQIAQTEFVPASLRGKPAAVMAAMLTGHEVGIGPMMALKQIHVVEGRPAMAAELMRALVQRAGHDIWFHEKSNTKVTIRAHRSTWPEDRVASVTWTIDDAKKAGLDGRQNWRKYPRAMLGARATAELCRDEFADVLGGISYTVEELTDGEFLGDGFDEVLLGQQGEPVEEPAGTTRRAARAATAAKKAPAKKTPAKKAAPAPAADTEAPPLPGEPGYDDAEDAVVVAADDRQAAIADRIDDLTDDQRKILTDWWKAEQLPSLTRRALTEQDAEKVEAKLDQFGEPADDHEAGATTGRNKKMHAMVAEAWPDEDAEGREKRRKGLISYLTDGGSESSKDLSEGQWDDLFHALGEIAELRMELFLRATGAYELRVVSAA